MTATKMSSEKGPEKQTAAATPNSTSATASRRAQVNFVVLVKFLFGFDFQDFDFIGYG